MRRLLYRRLIAPILSAHDSPEAVAGGVALGLGIGLTPTMGVQMPLAWLAATLCGASRVVAVALVWISNPLTILPMYYAQYVFGGWILDRSSISSFHDFSETWHAMAGMGALELLQTLSDTVAFPLLVGSGVCAVVGGCLSYPLALWWVRRRRRLRGLVPAGTMGADTRGTPRPRPDPGTVLLAATMLSVACTEGRGPIAQPGVPDERRVEIESTLRAGLSEELGLVALLVPEEEAGSGFAAERWRTRLGAAGQDVQLERLELLRIGGEGPLEFPQDGVLLTGTGDSGSSSNLIPSEVLDAASDPLTKARFGYGALPPLQPGEALRVTVILPSELAADPDLLLHSDRGELRLHMRTISSAALGEFRSDPGVEAFAELFGASEDTEGAE